MLASCSEKNVAEVTDFGLYDAVVVTKGKWQLGVPVEVMSTEGLKHRETTTRIPAIDGSYWGFRASLRNPNRTGAKTFRYTIEHPELTSPDGTKSTGSTEEFQLQSQQSLEVPFLWYFLEGCEFEFVPGTWTQRVYADGVEVIRKDFEIYKPN